ncbi:MAG: hypothetical protein MI749_05040 [Desulfovibrionales bacterium]|nr:hypothetical protein [Desulfovibrionales bacterium]
MRKKILWLVVLGSLLGLLAACGGGGGSGSSGGGSTVASGCVKAPLYNAQIVYGKHDSVIGETNIDGEIVFDTEKLRAIPDTDFPLVIRSQGGVFKKDQLAYQNGETAVPPTPLTFSLQAVMFNKTDPVYLTILSTVLTKQMMDEIYFGRSKELLKHNYNELRNEYARMLGVSGNSAIELPYSNLKDHEVISYMLCKLMGIKDDFSNFDSIMLKVGPSVTVFLPNLMERVNLDLPSDGLVTDFFTESVMQEVYANAATALGEDFSEYTLDFKTGIQPIRCTIKTYAHATSYAGDTNIVYVRKPPEGGNAEVTFYVQIEANRNSGASWGGGNPNVTVTAAAGKIFDGTAEVITGQEVDVASSTTLTWKIDRNMYEEMQGRDVVVSVASVAAPDVHSNMIIRLVDDAELFAVFHNLLMNETFFGLDAVNECTVTDTLALVASLYGGADYATLADYETNTDISFTVFAPDEFRFIVDGDLTSSISTDNVTFTADGGTPNKIRLRGHITDHTLRYVGEDFEEGYFSFPYVVRDGEKILHKRNATCYIERAGLNPKRIGSISLGGIKWYAGSGEDMIYGASSNEIPPEVFTDFAYPPEVVFFVSSPFLRRGGLSFMSDSVSVQTVRPEDSSVTVNFAPGGDVAISSDYLGTSVEFSLSIASLSHDSSETIPIQFLYDPDGTSGSLPAVPIPETILVPPLTP